MDKKKQAVSPMPVLGILVIMYVISSVLLFVLAVLLGKFEISDGMVSLGIIIAYIASCFTGGWLIGKKMKKKQYLWGLCVGILYFLVLLLGNLVMNRGLGGMSLSMVSTAVICLASATAGGMVS